MALTQINPALFAGSSNTTAVIQSNGTTAITVDTSQNVGIGGALLAGTPGGAAGKVLALAATQYPQSIMTATSGTTGNKNVRFIYRDSGVFQLQTLDDTYGSEVTVHEVQRSTTGITYQAFYTGTAGSVAERMRINSAGDLLVNQTAVILTGTIQFTFDGQNEQGMCIKNSANSQNGAAIRFIDYTNAYTGGGIYYTSSNSVQYVTSSDYRLKENIAPMTGALTKIQQLKPVTFNWKQDNSVSQGFIAHELQAVIPQAVNGTKDAVDKDGKPMYQGVDTSYIVATLTAAIQELKAINDTLTARIVALENK